MWITEFLKKWLEGRGIYPILIISFTWTYTIIMIGILVYQLLLYIFKVKYHNSEFNKSIKKDE